MRITVSPKSSCPIVRHTISFMAVYILTRPSLDMLQAPVKSLTEKCLERTTACLTTIFVVNALFFPRTTASRSSGMVLVSRSERTNSPQTCSPNWRKKKKLDDRTKMLSKAKVVVDTNAGFFEDQPGEVVLSAVLQ